MGSPPNSTAARTTTTRSIRSSATSRGSRSLDELRARRPPPAPALLVRDYFAQGFYPDGTNTNPNNAADKVATISGDLVKAILVTSAQTGCTAAGSNLDVGRRADQGLTRKYRFNREQGYGRIELTNALPLQSYSGAVSGLIVGDGGMNPAGGLIHSTNLDHGPRGRRRAADLFA